MHYICFISGLTPSFVLSEYCSVVCLCVSGNILNIGVLLVSVERCINLCVYKQKDIEVGLTLYVDFAE